MAIEPSNIKQVQHNGDLINIINMNSIPDFDKDDYNLSDGKDREKYFVDIEKAIRTSFEYREYVSYLREYMEMNKCSFFENINNIETSKIKIHLHHSPITLREIVMTIFNKRTFYHESLELEAVAKESMYVHYCLLIGLIPLCETVHELVHNGYIFIPNDTVLGKYKDFIDIYKQWIPPEIQSKLDRLEDFTTSYNEDENKAVLQTKYVYIDFAGAYKFPKMEDVLKSVSNTLNRLKENNFVNSIPMITFYDEEGNTID